LVRKYYKRNAKYRESGDHESLANDVPTILKPSLLLFIITFCLFIETYLFHLIFLFSCFLLPNCKVMFAHMGDVILHIISIWQLDGHKMKCFCFKKKSKLKLELQIIKDLLRDSMERILSDWTRHIQSWNSLIQSWFGFGYNIMDSIFE
jgi:hypothetical protein